MSMNKEGDIMAHKDVMGTQENEISREGDAMQLPQELNTNPNWLPILKDLKHLERLERLAGNQSSKAINQEIYITGNNTAESARQDLTNAVVERNSVSNHI